MLIFFIFQHFHGCGCKDDLYVCKWEIVLEVSIISSISRHSVDFKLEMFNETSFLTGDEKGYF